jgi:hypothetical protein
MQLLTGSAMCFGSLSPNSWLRMRKAQDKRDEPATMAEKKPPAPRVVEVPEQYTT